MSGIRLVTRARCLHPGCDWPTQEGDPATVDREARRHTGERGLSPKGPGHPTECWTEPITPLPANGDPK